MPSDLQRAAQGLVECLDQVPSMVGYLQRLAAQCRENAAFVADFSSGNPAARQAAMQLDAAARCCDEAAHLAGITPGKARDWATAMVGGTGGATARLSRGGEPARATIKSDNDAKPLRPFVRSSSGGRGAWNPELNKPAPNTTYVVDNRYTFTTDDNSRVILVEGRLAVGDKDRSPYRQQVAGGDDRQVDLDDGGHIIANRFMGPSEAINLVAQLRAQNRPSALDSANWYALERRWANAVAEVPPKTVEVSIAIRYPEDSLRPSSFRVRYRIDGGDWQVQRFNN
ncbi:MAG: hypothetical protein QOG10_2766 [Kribbellaceae bacterium]|nr:hypothetical protein [Kribbellaceae bacterium]